MNNQGGIGREGAPPRATRRCESTMSKSLLIERAFELKADKGKPCRIAPPKIVFYDIGRNCPQHDRMLPVAYLLRHRLGYS